MPETPNQAPSSPALTPPPLPPADKSPWNGWATLLWAVILFLGWQIIIYVGILIAAAIEGLLISAASNPEKLSTDGDVIGLITFATIFFVCPACWLIGKLRPGWTGWEYLGNARTNWWHWPLWGAATIACSIIFGILGPHLGVDGPDDSMVQIAKSTQFPLLLFLGVAIGAPFVEEFMFRGVLWRGWRASRLGLWVTLLLTSFFWAILHRQYPPILIAYIFCLGVIFGLAREKTGSLWIPVWMHALNNGLATLTMLNL